MRLLALDMSVNVGWVAFAEPAALHSRGTFVIRSAPSLGQRFDAFFCWLVPTLKALQPDVLAFEEPIRGVPWRPAGVTTTMHTSKLLQGLAAVAELAASRCAVPRCLEVPTSTAKKKLAGHGRADKHMMIAAAVRMGITVADEHQADALAVALVAFEHCGVFVRGADGPLLQDVSRW